MPQEHPPLSIRAYFVRKRNALLTRADFGNLYVDYYLHLAEHHLQNPSRNDRMLKEALAAVALHAASRPWNESIAWTLHFEDPLLNLFVAADNSTGSLIGHCLADNVRQTASNLFYAQVLRGNEPMRQSHVAFESASPFLATEAFYRQSEQRPARFFALDEEDFVFISAQPDCDLPWLQNLTLDQVHQLDQHEELSLLETRSFRWHCGCNQEKILHLLAPAMRADPEGLFDGGE
ncbi:MAG: disulfide bond chaperone, partial [Verrucomicrobiia bacterium]